MAYERKSQEELNAEKQICIDKIKNLAESYEEHPENIAELIAFKSKFYSYSPKNTMLIYSQNPYATFVGSFMHFKSQGYSVNKGEKGLKFLLL